MLTVDVRVPVPAFTKPVLLISYENMDVDLVFIVVEVFDKKAREWNALADTAIERNGTQT
jgi:hypothetical protein